MAYPISYYPASTNTYSHGRGGRKLEYIVIHYTGTSASAKNNCAYFAGGNRQASAHFFLDGSPTIYLSVPLDCAAWAVGNMDMNCRSISIEVVSNGKNFTGDEIEQLKYLVPYLQKKYGIDDKHVIRHYDVADHVRYGKTLDPHKHCPAAYVNNVKWNGLKGTVLSGKENVEVPKKEYPENPKVYKSVIVDGYAGYDTISALQQLFNVKKTGHVIGQNPDNEKLLQGFTSIDYDDGGDELVKAVQKQLKIKVDGYAGYDTIVAFQKALGVEADGYAGKDTAKAVQRFVNNMLECYGDRKTVSQWLGCTGNVYQWLKSHENDNYYLGTRYLGCHNYGNAVANAKPYLTAFPNGELKNPNLLKGRMEGYKPGMNCAGFVSHVLYSVGGNIEKVDRNGTGWYCNLGNWLRSIRNNDIKHYTFKSKKELLASALPQPGDILIFEPESYADGHDGHVVYYWGNGKMWSSGSPNHIVDVSNYYPWKYNYIIVPTGNYKPALVDGGQGGNKPQPPKGDDANTDVIYRVQVGAYKERQNAVIRLAQLKRSGFNGFLTKVDGLYKAQVGAFKDKKNADALVNKLKSKGFGAFATTKKGTIVSVADDEINKVSLSEYMKAEDYFSADEIKKGQEYLGVDKSGKVEEGTLSALKNWLDKQLAKLKK